MPAYVQQPPLQRKPIFPIRTPLREYLSEFQREVELPVLYRDLEGFMESMPLPRPDGTPSLWETVIYEQPRMQRINQDLTRIYAILKVDGDLSVMRHLYVDRIDYCTFGNSLPFRVRIVNAYNDNQDYFYIKRADASRAYGLELEHLLSPNRMNFLTCGDTLVEEHLIGIPGNVFVEKWLYDGTLKPIRVAKELVKFNERCFVRLLGDMRSYNFVVLVVPDFDEPQIRIRAMDFDQQSHHGRKNFYLPQFFPENRELALFCIKHLNPTTTLQYQREEQSLMVQRTEVSRRRVDKLISVMAADSIAPPENVSMLGAGLAEHYQNPRFESCRTMGELVRESLSTLQRNFRKGVTAAPTSSLPLGELSRIGPEPATGGGRDDVVSGGEASANP